LIRLPISSTLERAGSDVKFVSRFLKNARTGSCFPRLAVRSRTYIEAIAPDFILRILSYFAWARPKIKCDIKPEFPILQNTVLSIQIYIYIYIYTYIYIDAAWYFWICTTIWERDSFYVYWMFKQCGIDFSSLQLFMFFFEIYFFGTIKYAQIFNHKLRLY